jgi:uncharacterized membrane protein
MAISIKPRPITAAPADRRWPMVRSRLGVFLVTVVLGLGLLFRVSHLDRKTYWGDEIYSSLRVLGFQTMEVVQGIATGAPIGVEALQKYQQIAPGKGIGDTLNVLAQEDAHMTPLYFVLARIWIEGFGPSIVAMRSLSVLLSLLTLPACYWLSRELFNSVAIARLTVILNVISPIYLVYAQEARMYSLWSLTTIVAMASLLQAQRQTTWKNWGIFSLALTLQFYSHLFGLVTLLAYGLYLLKLGSPAVQMRRFGLAVGTALAAFSPWLWIFVNRSVRIKEDWDETTTPIGLVKHWAAIFGQLFIDFNVSSKLPSLALGITLIGILIGLGVVLYGSYALYRETRQRTWLFILLIVVVPTLGPLYAYHTVMLASRYLLPGYIGLQLIAAYVLGSRVFGYPCDSSCGHPYDRQNYPFNSPGQATPSAARKRMAWSIALGAVVLSGVLSCGQMMMSDTWWNKQYSNCNTRSAQLINHSINPLVISDTNDEPYFNHPLSNILSLGTALKPNVHFQIFANHQYPAIAERFSDRFVLTPSPALRAHLQSSYGQKFQPVYLGTQEYRGSKVCLWKLTD